MMSYVLLVDSARVTGEVYGPFTRQMDAESAFYVIKEQMAAAGKPAVAFSIREIQAPPAEDKPQRALTYVIVKKFYADGPSMYEYVLTAPGTPCYLNFKRLKDAKAAAQADAGRPLVWTLTKHDDGSSTATEYQAVDTTRLVPAV
jgi:hypothetical protein